LIELYSEIRKLVNSVIICVADKCHTNSCSNCGGKLDIKPTTGAPRSFK